ncbi:MAG: Crp/Fnr family transcriptional regulator [Bdellovibrionaceae bacterium]|nr:Crp/Fnr family transcriptional regulator [Pseudobdellovibrionaceae bacterium]
MKPGHTHTTTDCEKCETKSKGFMCSTSDEISEKISHFKADCKYKAGEVIFRTGDTPLGLFSVRRGVVKLESLSEEGDSHTLNLVGAGGMLGYRTFFKGESYKNSAIALEDTEVCFLPRKEVLELFTCHPELGLKMVNQLVVDLDQAETKWVDQIDKGAPARVADALLFLNEKFSGTSWTRKEIAEWAGTTTETVIRTLALFEKEGIISQNYKNFTILSEEKLNEKANS